MPVIISSSVIEAQRRRPTRPSGNSSGTKKGECIVLFDKAGEKFKVSGFAALAAFCTAATKAAEGAAEELVPASSPGASASASSLGPSCMAESNDLRPDFFT